MSGYRHGQVDNEPIKKKKKPYTDIVREVSIIAQT